MTIEVSQYHASIKLFHNHVSTDHDSIIELSQPRDYVLSCHNIEVTQDHASIELSQLKIMPILSYLKTISWMPVITKCENKLNEAILNAAAKNVKNDCLRIWWIFNGFYPCSWLAFSCRNGGSKFCRLVNEKHKKYKPCSLDGYNVAGLNSGLVSGNNEDARFGDQSQLVTRCFDFSY